MDKITPFVVGATRNEEFYSARFSAQKYFYSNGVPVPRGTKLHHHTEPAPGDNYFMTQHNMSGAVNVFTLQGLRVGVPNIIRNGNGNMNGNGNINRNVSTPVRTPVRGNTRRNRRGY